jgi:ribosomal protein S18 acetylase RimI-like enzyme
MAASDHLGVQFEHRQMNEWSGSVHAVRGDRTIGQLDWSRAKHDPPGTVFVDMISVSPEHRRQGIGSALMNNVKATPIYAEGGEEVGNTEEGWKFLQAWERNRG